MSISALISFIGVSMLLTIAPGPDNLFVVAQSVSHGRKAGIATALGLCSGLMFHTTAAALGISAILYKSNLAFQLIKYLGAFYLLYLAWQAFREGKQFLTTEKVEERSVFSLYRKGILMNVLNPKVSLFFLAFLPQFVSLNQGNVPLQMITLGLIFMLQSVLIFVAISLFASTIGKKLLLKPGVGRWINLTKGTLFSIIGIRLAFIRN